MEAIKKIERYHKPLAILCEKPMGDDLIQGYEIVNICKKLGVSLYVNYIRTCLPGSKEVKKLIDNNLIKSGKVFDVYVGKNMPDDKKSIALNVTIQSSKKTLNEDDFFIIMVELSLY